MLFLAAGLGIWAAPVRGISAAQAQVSEFEVKVAFIYNFTKFVSWPRGSAEPGDRPFQICTFGTTRLDAPLEALSGKSTQDRPIVISHGTEIGTVGRCQVIVVGDVSKQELRMLLSAVGARPVLTVGDQADFIQDGGMIGFSIVDERIRFSINLAAATGAGLSISSQMLKLAIRVEG